MKTIFIIFIFNFLLFLTLQARAQKVGQGQGKPMVTRQEADSLRIDIMSREMHLSPEESKKFWPYFDQYTQELQTLDQTYFHKVGIFKNTIDKLNDAALTQIVSDDFNFQQQKLDLKKRYNSIFKSFLPIRKLAHYYIAQDQFSRQLIRYRIKKGLNKPL